jgi:hypothetical protein
MALHFDPPADPLTPKSRGQSYVIESDALERLIKDISRYGRRELAGRSILIAGHRGVGKTTLVRKAIESVRSTNSSYEGRPLFVDLHGPDLLAPPDREAAPNPAPPAKPDAKPDDGAAPKEKPEAVDAPAPANAAGGADSQQPSGADLQSFVERLTFSLYRAATKEFVESFRALRDAGPGSESRYMEFSELAEQFALELDGSTDLGRIRLLYERVDAFAQGVLKTARGSTGSQELALLASSSQAYRIISGRLDEDLKRENKAQNASTWSAAADNFLSPVSGLLTGAAVWTALAGELGPLAKLMSSFATGLAAAFVIKFTRSVSRESKQSSTVTFVPDRSKRTLRRLLPVLVDRFCDAGLPPIFVVDELDKVPDISQRMESLMGFLKQFVTERAFFCFLVDRDYYERLEATLATSAFPKEATLFGDRLFVQYTPEAVHAYLKNVTKVGTLAAGDSQEDANRDLDALSYVLLRRSCMHPYDLRREVSRSTDAKNDFVFPPRVLFNTPQYRDEVYYQAAVECVLSGERLIDFAGDSRRAQLLYDALYFPIRTKRPPEEFDASRKALEDHLAERMGKDNVEELSKEDLGVLHQALTLLVRFLCTPRELLDTMNALAAPRFHAAPKKFPAAVMGIIEVAAGPKPAAASAPPANAAQTASAAAAGAGAPASSAPLETATQSAAAAGSGAPAATGSAAPASAPEANSPSPELTQTPGPPAPASPTPPGPPATPPATDPRVLLAAGSGPLKYRWQWDRFGYPAPQTESEAEIEAQIKMTAAGPGSQVTAAVDDVVLGDLDQAAKLLAAKQGTEIDIDIWEQMRLIPTPPAWSYVREAADALRNPASLPQAKADEYGKAILQYRSNFQASLAPAWKALAIAEVMALHDRSSRQMKARWWLEKVAEVLADSPSRELMVAQLDSIWGSMDGGGALRGDTPPSNASFKIMLEGFAAGAKVVLSRPALDASIVAQQTGTFYENWFSQFYEGRRPVIDSLWPFLGLVSNSLPFGLRRINPLRMTIHDWSRGEPDEQNLWQRVVSLERLGFRREAEVQAGEPKDQFLAIVLQSIRKRGYEKAAVILQPRRPSLTAEWLPSENIACRVRRPGTNLDTSTKYLLIEVEQPTNPNTLDTGNVSSRTRVALFGAFDAPDPRSTFLGYPYVANPQNLDDLVGRLDDRPPRDWADAKLAPPA